MKLAATTLFLLGVIRAYSQAIPPQQAAPEDKRVIVASLTPVYKSLSDTTKAALLLSKNDAVIVTGTPAPGWFAIRRGKTPYVVATRYIGPQSAAAVPVSLPVDPTTGIITYSEVVQVPGVSQAELYIRSKEWFVKSFRHPNAVIQVDEKEDGVLIGKTWQDNSGYSLLDWVSDGKLWYTVKITVKEGRYKYELSNFMNELYPTRLDVRPPDPYAVETYILDAKKPNGKPRYSVVYLQQRLNAAALALASTIKVSMTGKGNDW